MACRFCTGDSALQSEMAWHASLQYDTQSNPRLLARSLGMSPRSRFLRAPRSDSEFAMRASEWNFGKRA